MLLVLQKLWVFIKTYWKLLAVIVGFIVVYFVFGNTGKSLLGIIQGIQDAHKKELEDLDKLKKEEEQKKQENLDKMNAELHDEEAHYLNELKKVEEKKEVSEEKILQETGSDPEKLTDELGQITGIEVEK